MTVRGTVAISAYALAFVGALGAMPGVARADEEEREAVPLPVVRASMGFTTEYGNSDSTLLAELDLGVHLHYGYFFFGGETGYAAAETGALTSTQFFHLGGPIGVTSEEAYVGFAFVPRVFVGQRDAHDVTALRIGAAVYGLGGAFSFELGHERWFGDGGAARLIGIFGVDAGRVLYLIIDDGDLDEIR